MECEYDGIEVLKDYQRQDIFFIARRRRLNSYSAERNLKYLNPKLFEMYQNPKFREWIENLEFECEGGLIAGGKFVHKDFRL